MFCAIFNFQTRSSGADDYITKPFEIREVLASIQVQLRQDVYKRQVENLQL